MFVKLCNRYNYDESISLIADIDEIDLKLQDLKVQLVQLSKMVRNCKDVFIGNTIEILSDFGKGHGETLLISEVLNLAELLLVFLKPRLELSLLEAAMKHIQNYFQKYGD